MINKDSIKDSMLSTTLKVTDIIKDIDNSLVISYDILDNGQPPDTKQHAFYWLIETWLKNNNIPYKVDRNKPAYSSRTGLRVFGEELTDIDYFITNLL